MSVLQQLVEEIKSNPLKETCTQCDGSGEMQVLTAHGMLVTQLHDALKETQGIYAPRKPSRQDRLSQDLTAQQLADSLNLSQLTTDYLEYSAQAADAGKTTQADVITFILDALETEACIHDEAEDFNANKETMTKLFNHLYQLDHQDA